MNQSDLVLSGTVERTSEGEKTIKCRIKSLYKGTWNAQSILIELPSETPLFTITNDVIRRKRMHRNGCFSDEQSLDSLRIHDTRIFFVRRRQSGSPSNRIEMVLFTQVHVTKTLLSKLRILSLSSECTT